MRSTASVGPGRTGVDWRLLLEEPVASTYWIGQ